MARYGRGLICLPMTGERLDELRDSADGAGRREQRTLRDGLLRSDRGQARDHDGHLGGRPVAHRARRHRPEHAAFRPGPAGSHVPAACGFRRRAGARRTDRGGGGPGPPGGAVPGRGDLRGHGRGRHHGARPAARGRLSQPRPQDDHHQGPDPVPNAPRASRAQDRRGRAAHRLRPLPHPRLREPDRRPAPRRAGDGRDRPASRRAGARPLAVPDRRHLHLDPLRLRRPATRCPGAGFSKPAGACSCT